MRRKLKFAFLLLVMVGCKGRQARVLTSYNQITPEAPRETIDTTYNLPRGRQWAAHSADDLRSALSGSVPGDVIVLDAGITYTGLFVYPPKTYPPAGAGSNPWIYIISSQLANLPAGQRIDPNRDAIHMPKIVSPGSTSPFTIKDGSKYLRLAGIEMYSDSNQGCQPNSTPPVNCFTYQLVYAEGRWSSTVLPDHITVDRCYLHGSPQKDVREGVFGNANHLAVIDSYISDIHQSRNDSQAILSYVSNGPIKITNNFLSATGEDVMFGGAGGKDNVYQPADIEIRGNHFFKPLEWAQVGITIPPNHIWTVKNNLEFKSGKRAIVEDNTFENNWKSGQEGFSIVFTVRTGQSGDTAVVNDILFTNNILKNVQAGFSTLAEDNSCGDASYPNCANKGESKRIKVINNAIQYRDPTEIGGARNMFAQLASGLSDYEFAANSTIPASEQSCWGSIYFSVKQGTQWPPAAGTSITNNIWILDNAFCKQITGDNGAQGETAVERYMGQPSPASSRFKGNVFWAPPPEKPQTWPPMNTASASMQFDCNYKLVDPVWKQTTTGKQAGYQGK